MSANCRADLVATGTIYREYEHDLHRFKPLFLLFVTEGMSCHYQDPEDNQMNTREWYRHRINLQNRAL